MGKPSFASIARGYLTYTELWVEGQGNSQKNSRKDGDSSGFKFSLASPRAFRYSVHYYFTHACERKGGMGMEHVGSLKIVARVVAAVVLLGMGAGTAVGQIDSGSDGSDGALDLTGQSGTYIIDMHDHPNGIYNYTHVNIPAGVTVNFIPNDANSPVVWLVQDSCLIQGTVSLDGQFSVGILGGIGGPGGFRGGNPGVQPDLASGPGFGPGGGGAASSTGDSGNASFGSLGTQKQGQSPAGNVYGTSNLVPLVGGSGGGGGGGRYYNYWGGGGGGGGAILIAATDTISVNGTINANGADGVIRYGYCGLAISAGGGSGGAIRLVSGTLNGIGLLSVRGGTGPGNPCIGGLSGAGSGRIRLEALSFEFVGQSDGITSHGVTGYIFPPTNQQPKLNVGSIGGVSISSNPGGQAALPDAVLFGLQNTPVNIVMQCQNLPLNTLITVDVKPSHGAMVSGTGYNTSGTLSSSTANVLIDPFPPGGGTIQAYASSGP